MKGRISVALALALSISVPALAAGYRLAPYKDDLFKYPKLLSTEAAGDYVVVQYIQSRDLDQRDVVPEKKTKDEYVSLDTKAVEQDLAVRDGTTTVKVIGVGKTEGKAKAVVIYLHGRNGSRFQGANDWMFGGNFNRIKNLMMRNGGVYLSPDFTDMGKTGTNEIKALIRHFHASSPGAPIFVACGSLGGSICWALGKDAEAAPMLGGLLLLGSSIDEGFLKNPALHDAAKRLPIYIGHGSHDSLMSWEPQREFFKKIKAAAPDYPIKFALFDTGSHGTPIRMTDWRLILNWMLEVDKK
jgi:hypothetical protein